MKHIKSYNLFELHSSTYYSAAHKLKKLEGESDTYNDMITTGNYREISERPIISNKIYIDIYKNSDSLKNIISWRQLKEINSVEKAFLHNSIEMGQLIIDKYRDNINHIVDADGSNLLMQVIYGFLSEDLSKKDTNDWINFCIYNKININEHNDLKLSALVLLVRFNHYDLVEILLNNGANPNSGVTEKPLYYAIRENNLDMVKLLIKYGAETTDIDDRGRTALEFSESRDTDRDIIIYLDRL